MSKWKNLGVGLICALAWNTAPPVLRAEPSGSATTSALCVREADGLPPAIRISACSTLLEALRQDPSIGGPVAVPKNRKGSLCEKDNTEACWRTVRIARVLGLRSSAYSSADDLDRALADINEAIRLAPLWNGLYSNRAALNIQKRDYEAAIRDGEWLNKKAREEVSYEGLRCWIRVSEGRDLVLARKLCNESLRRRPQNPEFMGMLGVAEMKAGNYQLAYDWFQNTLRWAPTEAGAMYGRGVAAHLLGRPDEAKTSIAAAEKINAKIAFYFERSYNLGSLLPPELGPPPASAQTPLKESTPPR